MDNKLTKKYGLFTAIAMVVGIVIGSGVFFKAQNILNITQGNLTSGILAWIIGGVIMLVCAYTFAVMATKYEKVNGVVDYAEATVGKKYGYYVGWFMATIYYPTLTGVLAWVSARYFCELFGWSPVGAETLAVAGLFLVLSYALNSLSPKLAGKFQVSSTVIKLVPLILMAVVGIIAGLVNGTTLDNFQAALPGTGGGKALFASVVATAFAYEGWIIATSINAELKDAKKNLPRALVGGSILVMAVYIFYFIGVAGAASVSDLQTIGARVAFINLFSSVGGTVLMVFVVISCLGTLNGLMLGCTRGLYALAVRRKGPNPEALSQVDNVTNMPTNSAIVGLLLASVWLVYFFGANLVPVSWFGSFSFDSSELPIVTIYALYIPIFFFMIKKETDLPTFKRFVAPIAAIVACAFMVFAAIYSHEMKIVFYLILFAVIMFIGFLFSLRNKAVE
jgi:APA family basic amino acid/polyamine antiporter